MINIHCKCRFSTIFTRINCDEETEFDIWILLCQQIWGEMAAFSSASSAVYHSM